MTALVPIGEFARLTHLTVKTLRYYHDIGLLPAAEVDDYTGYRRYSTVQVSAAHLIRRLRDLDMPIPQVREVLRAEGTDARNAALRAHLTHMEAELTRTRDVVASLRGLLGPAAPLPVEIRTVPELAMVAMRGRVHRDDIADWCADSFPRLYRHAGSRVAGAGGASYGTDFFADDIGEVTAFVPVGAGPLLGAAGDGTEWSAAGPGSEPTETVYPARSFAVAVHEGSFEEFDRTYGALGSYVAEHTIALPEPIREIYLVGPNHTDDATAWRTEVCWPIRER